LVFKVCLVKIENFEDAPHPQVVNAEDTEKENNSQGDAHIALKSKRICR